MDGPPPSMMASWSAGSTVRSVGVRPRRSGASGTARLAFAYVLCRPCRDTGGVRRVEGLFTQRYEAGGVRDRTVGA